MSNPVFNDRRKGNRQVVATLVVIIFVLLGAFAFVVSALVEQGHRIEAIALNAEEAADGARREAEEAQPCNEGDPPDKPSCRRAARTERVIAAALDLVRQAIATGIELHDLNTHRQHEDLRQRVSEAPPTPVERTPITAPPPTTTTTSIPPSTTTVAPRLTVPIPSLIPSLTPPPLPEDCQPRGKSGKCR